MDAYETGLLVQAFACNARVAGMVAENEQRQQCGNSIAYGVEAFSLEADLLEHLASALKMLGHR